MSVMSVNIETINTLSLWLNWLNIILCSLPPNMAGRLNSDFNNESRPIVEIDSMYILDESNTCIEYTRTVNALAWWNTVPRFTTTSLVYLVSKTW